MLKKGYTKRTLEPITSFWLNVTAKVDSGNSIEEIPIKIKLDTLVDVLLQGQSCESKEFAKQKLIELGLTALEIERGKQ